MEKFVGTKNGKILLISDTEIDSQNLIITSLPSELHQVSTEDLMLNYRYNKGQIIKADGFKPANQLKVALVSNWKMKCGIATYAEELYRHIIDQVGDFKLFVENNDNLTGSMNVIGPKIIDEDKVLECWKRGEPTQRLVNAIKEYNPDIVWIQHEYGLWPNARHWLVMMSQLSEFRVITTMHSVFHHQDKTICEAAMPEIVVHLPGAKTLLEETKQVPGKVYVIPHGCSPITSSEKLWNLYKSEHTFIQFGFGFSYKGWGNSLKTTAILKQKYPDIFFTGLFSESPFNKVNHQVYFDELMEMVQNLDIQNNVGLIRGYQSDITLNSYLRTNKAALFPYVSHPLHEVFGASGAARFSMAKGIPVITSNVNHFSDLPTIKAETPEEMAQALDKLFSNKELQKRQIEKQNSYIEEHTWEKMAGRYLRLFG